jgi:hypothetical protein
VHGRHDYSNTVALGDLNGDGWLDLALADNNQLAGGPTTGRPRSSSTTARETWARFPSGLRASEDGSRFFVDPTRTATSIWPTGTGSKCRIYENQVGTLPANPTWRSNTTSTVEHRLGDVNIDGLQPGLSESFTGDGALSLFVLERRPVRVSGS